MSRPCFREDGILSARVENIHSSTHSPIRTCGESDLPAMLMIINEAAQAYHGKIPGDCWHDPYMADEELRSEIAAGVNFVGYELSGGLVGVMGVQSVSNVELIRHAYVLSDRQGLGIGSALIEHLRSHLSRRILIGTWADAIWAIASYEGMVLSWFPPTRPQLCCAATGLFPTGRSRRRSSFLLLP